MIRRFPCPLTDRLDPGSSRTPVNQYEQRISKTCLRVWRNLVSHPLSSPPTRGHLGIFISSNEFLSFTEVRIKRLRWFISCFRSTLPPWYSTRLGLHIHRDTNTLHNTERPENNLSIHKYLRGVLFEVGLGSNLILIYGWRLSTRTVTLDTVRTWTRTAGVVYTNEEMT